MHLSAHNFTGVSAKVKHMRAHIHVFTSRADSLKTWKLKTEGPYFDLYLYIYIFFPPLSLSFCVQSNHSLLRERQIVLSLILFWSAPWLIGYLCWLLSIFCCCCYQHSRCRFRWTLYKTLEFLHSRRPDLEIRANFFNQLLVIENRLTKLGFGAKSYNWKELSDKADTEEILLTNTFINSKNVESADFKESSPEKPKQSKVKWIDNKQEDAQTPTVCTVIIPVYEDCTFKPRSQSQKNIKSAMKVTFASLASQSFVDASVPRAPLLHKHTCAPHTYTRTHAHMQAYTQIHTNTCARMFTSTFFLCACVICKQTGFLAPARSETEAIKRVQQRAPCQLQNKSAYCKKANRQV